MSVVHVAQPTLAKPASVAETSTMGVVQEPRAPSPPGLPAPCPGGRIDQHVGKLALEIHQRLVDTIQPIAMSK